MIFSKTAANIGRILTERNEKVCVAESSTGGLISANLLSVSGASAFYEGGSVVYTLASRRAFLDLDRERLQGLEPLTEAMVIEFARSARAGLDCTWAIAELGAAGPSGSPYGHSAGTSVIGIVGPIICSTTITTRADHRADNMAAFTKGALMLFETALS